MTNVSHPKTREPSIETVSWLDELMESAPPMGLIGLAIDRGADPTKVQLALTHAMQKLVQEQMSEMQEMLDAMNAVELYLREAKGELALLHEIERLDKHASAGAVRWWATAISSLARTALGKQNVADLFDVAYSASTALYGDEPVARSQQESAFADAIREELIPEDLMTAHERRIAASKSNRCPDAPKGEV